MPEEARKLIDEARTLLEEVQPQAAKIARGLNRYRWFVRVLVALVLAVGGLGYVTFRQSQCNSDFSNGYAVRANALTNLANVRNDANTQLIRDAFIPGIARAQIDADFEAIKNADDAYKKAQKDNPIPASPKYHCSIF